MCLFKAETLRSFECSCLPSHTSAIPVRRQTHLGYSAHLRWMIKNNWREGLPGGPVITALLMQGRRFHPWLGNKIPHAMGHGKKKEFTNAKPNNESLKQQQQKMGEVLPQQSHLSCPLWRVSLQPAHPVMTDIDKTAPWYGLTPLPVNIRWFARAY